MRVGVGTPRQTRIPPLDLPRYGPGRLSGIRCIATQLQPGEPDTSALTAMAVQRLDALAVLTLTGTGFQRRGGGEAGYIDRAYIAQLEPHPTEANWNLSPPLTLENLTEPDFLEGVEALEAEWQRYSAAREVEIDRDRAVIVGVQTAEVSDVEFQNRLDEIARLVDTAGGVTLQTLSQKRQRLHPQTVIGAGKAEEVALAAQTVSANLIVFDRDLSPAQVRNLESRIGVRVVDRTEVILDIFAQRARTGAGKLQVELAQLEYNLPRLTGFGQAMSRLGGGIGTRGPGETQLETERRAVRRRINRLQQEVDRLQAHRSRLRDRRVDRDVPSIAIVGYTNAGKSTLLNALTESDIYAADQLFATLDPTTRRLSVLDPETEEYRSLVLTDTVGFIHELPPTLMDAFRATLEEVTEADALLHVVDLSHPAWKRQIQSVTDILGEMPIATGPVLLAFNKIDRADGNTLEVARQQYPRAAFVSATENLGLATLRSRLLRLVESAIAVS